MEIINYIENTHLILNFILLAVGLVILIKGSDFFIDSAIYFAHKFHVSEIIIGLTLVSIGTSLPELAVNISAAIKGRSAIAIGNVTGSNITNIALVIGISAIIIGKIKIPKKLFFRDMYFLLGVTTLLLIFSYFFDGNNYRINHVEAVIMFLLIIFYIIYLLKFNKEDVNHELREHEEIKIKSMFIAISLFLGGILCIYLGSEIMIRNAIIIAEKLHISDGVIGATIIALGTSLPELSVTIIGIIKNKSDISLGNIIGSNIFNILGVLGITGIIRNIDITNISNGSPDTKMLFWTLPLTLFIAILLFIFMSIKMQLSRIKGIIFLLFYIGFIIFNFVKIP